MEIFMTNATLVQLKVDSEIKEDVSRIYENLGLDLPTAIRIFFKKSIAVGGLPFESPESFAVWQSKKQRPYPYRKINVGNYTVWYVVIDHIMEVRRILYSRRDEETLI